MIPEQTTDLLTGLRYVNITIEHQPHATNYMSVEEYLRSDWAPEMLDEDKAECIKTGQLWIIHWYPDTPVGFYHVAASTLERAIELARAVQ